MKAPASQASHLVELERSGENQLSLTGPDARAMAPMTNVGIGYNIQIAVDEKHKLIAGQEVCNRVLDSDLLTDTAKAAKDVSGAEFFSVVADRGYFQIEDLEACEAAGITPFVPKPTKGSAKRNGLFAKEDFTYDVDQDGYHCPGGQFLPLRGKGKIRGRTPRRSDNGYGICFDCTLILRHPKPFRLTKSADSILSAIEHFCQRTLDVQMQCE